MNIVTLFENLLNEITKAEENFYSDLKDFASLEQSVKDSAQSFAAQYLSLVLNNLNEYIKKDSSRKENYSVQRNDQRTLITSVGDVVFNNTYYKSKEKDDGNKYCYILEEMIGLSAHERFSECAETELIKSSIKNSYSEAVNVLPTESEITKTSVMNKVHNLCDYIPETDENKEHEKKKCKYLYIDADEDHVSEQHGRWNIDNSKFLSKLIYLYETKEKDKTCKNRRKLVETVYFSGVYEGTKNNSKLWNNVFEYINKHYDYNYIDTVYIIGDGAGWIKSGCEHIPKSKFCFDKFHLVKYINSAANQMLDENEFAKKKIYKYLYTRKKKSLIEYIKSMESCANNQDPIINLRKVIERNWAPIMRTLHDKRVMGCSAEGHVSHMLSDRLSSRPRAWSKTGADRISKLRCYDKNYGSEKIIDVVKFSRRQRQLERTGTDDIDVDKTKIYDLVLDKKSDGKEYIDKLQATIPGHTSSKSFAIKEQIKLI